MGTRPIHIGDTVLHNNGGSSPARFHEVLFIHNHLAMIRSINQNAKGETGSIQLMRLDRLQADWVV